MEEGTGYRRIVGSVGGSYLSTCGTNGDGFPSSLANLPSSKAAQLFSRKVNTARVRKIRFISASSAERHKAVLSDADGLVLLDIYSGRIVSRFYIGSFR